MPTFIVLSNQGQLRRFPYSGALTAEGMSAHIQAFLNDELKPSLKSEQPLPLTTDL